MPSVPTPPPSKSLIPTGKEYDFYKVVQDYLERAGKVAKIEQYVQTILSQPKNEIIINFPVRMDDGEVRLFKGYRVQHNNLLGPFKGGIRFHPNVTLDDVKALAAPVLRHRVIVAPELELEGVSADDALATLIQRVEAPRG